MFKIIVDEKAYIFLQDGETISASLTYGELDLQAKRIASHLQLMELLDVDQP